MLFKKILTSGYTFSDEEYHSKLNYILFNSLLLFNMVLLSLAMILRFFKENYAHASMDLIYVSLAIITFLLARRSRDYFNILFCFIMVFSYITTTFAFYMGFNPVAGIGWYFILLMTVFFIRGYRQASIIFAISLATIIFISYHRGVFSNVEIFLGVTPFFAGFFFLYFFDKRNRNFRDTVESQKNMYAYQAQHDGLTGLPNREVFFTQFSKLRDEAKYSKEKIAILFIDLDNFKVINDNLGHQVGDNVLIEVSRRLQSKIEENHILARFGGDEFAVLLTDIQDRQEVEQYILDFFEIMDRAIKTEEYEIDVRFSVGCSIYPDDGRTESILLGNADRAMYKAKKSTTKKYFFYAETAND